MSYDRIALVNGDLIDEAVFEKIDNSFERLYQDIYDTKVINKWELVDATTSNLLKPSYVRETQSSISGWWACVGAPQHFNKIKFVIKPIEGETIETIMIKIAEMPPRSEITFTEGTRGVSPRPNAWPTLVEKAISFNEENALTPGVYNIVELLLNIFISLFALVYAT